MIRQSYHRGVVSPYRSANSAHDALLFLFFYFFLVQFADE